MGKIAMIVLAVSVLLAACTPYMYGVPQETWDRMSEPERIEAIHRGEGAYGELPCLVIIREEPSPVVVIRETEP